MSALSASSNAAASSPIHDEREPLAPPQFAHLLNGHHTLTGDQPALAL